MGDALSLPIGEGGIGLGPERILTRGSAILVQHRVPRNAPSTFILGQTSINSLFHDGRVAHEPGYPSGFKSPASMNLPNTLENIVAAQAMFPPTSGAEMAGQAGENPVADASARGRLTVKTAYGIYWRSGFATMRSMLPCSTLCLRRSAMPTR